MFLLLCINFTYKSPNEDMALVMGFNPDGTVNVKYTLMALRDLLIENTNKINKLIEKHYAITDILPIEYGNIEIITNSPDIVQSLVDEQILTTKLDSSDNEDSDFDGSNFSDDDETNQERLHLINNLVNQNEINSIFNQNEIESESDTDSESESDEIIDDDDNKHSIITKYKKMISENDLDDSDNTTSYEDDY